MIFDAHIHQYYECPDDPAVFLEQAQKEGQVVSCDDLPKSFVLTVEYGMTRLYESTLTPATLEKRLK